jgi:hypothetical protein
MNKNQETFEKIAKHLFKQGKAARSKVYGTWSQSQMPCQYRVGRLTCAVGCLLPKKMYDPLMENTTVRDLRDKFPNVLEMFLSSKAIII